MNILSAPFPSVGVTISSSKTTAVAQQKWDNCYYTVCSSSLCSGVLWKEEVLCAHIHALLTLAKFVYKGFTRRHHFFQYNSVFLSCFAKTCIEQVSDFYSMTVLTEK